MYEVQLEEQADANWLRYANQLSTRIVALNAVTDNPDSSDDSARLVITHYVHFADSPQFADLPISGLPNIEYHGGRCDI